MTYRVDLDIFNGPMDLLLYLIRKEEVDIYDISIAKITDQYLGYVELLKNLDIEVACDFLVMAATLMQIKSAMLLPKAETDEIDAEDPGDPRTELIRQLLEYKKFKDAANMLRDAAEEQSGRFVRPDTVLAAVKPSSEPELDLDQVSIWDLLEAFDTIMKATGRHADYSRISDDTPIDLYQIEVLGRLQSDGSLTFRRIFEGKQSKVAMIGLFLGLLELIRNKLVWVEQEETSGELFLKALTDEPAELAVQNAIRAQIEPEDDEPARAAAEADGEAAVSMEIEAEADMEAEAEFDADDEELAKLLAEDDVEVVVDTEEAVEVIGETEVEVISEAEVAADDEAVEAVLEAEVAAEIADNTDRAVLEAEAVSGEQMVVRPAIPIVEIKSKSSSGAKQRFEALERSEG